MNKSNVLIISIAIGIVIIGIALLVMRDTVLVEPDIAAILPSGTMGYISVYDMNRIVKSAKDTGLFELLFGDFQENTQDREAEMRDFLRYLQHINVAHVVLNDVWQEWPELGVILDANLPVMRFLPSLLKNHGLHHVGTRENVDIYSYALQTPEWDVFESIFLAGYKNRLYISNDKNYLESLITAERAGLVNTLADSESYRAVSSDFKDGGLVAYVSGVDIMRVLERHMHGSELREFQAYTSSYGLSDIQKAGFSINKDSMRFSLHLNMRPGSRVTSILSQPEQKKVLADYLPSDTLYLLACNISDPKETWTKVQDFVFNIMRESAGGFHSRHEFENLIREMEYDLGVQIDEILSLLGEEIGIFLGSESMIFSGAATLKDASRAQFLLERMFRGEAIQRRQHEGITIYTVGHQYETFMSWAVMDDVIILSHSEKLVMDAVLARLRRDTLEKYSVYRDSAKGLPAENVFQAYVNIGQMFASEGNALNDFPPEVRRFVDRLGVSVALRSDVNDITIQLASSNKFTFTEFVGEFLNALMPVLELSAVQSSRAACINNVRSLVQMAHMYAIDNNGVFPKSFEELNSAGYTTGRLTICPKAGEKAYGFNTGLKEDSPPNTPLLGDFDSSNHGGDGGNIGYLDGSVRWHEGSYSAGSGPLSGVKPDNWIRQ